MTFASPDAWTPAWVRDFVDTDVQTIRLVSDPTSPVNDAILATLHLGEDGAPA